MNIGLIKTLAAVMPFEVVAMILYYKALKLTDISLSVPFLALTPVFACFTGFLLLGEKVNAVGLTGVILITVGVYSLNIKPGKLSAGDFSHPIRAILRNKGSLYMAAVAILYSVTSTMSKKAMLFSSPETIPFIYNLCISLSMLPVIIYRMAVVPKAGMKIRPGIILIFCIMGLLSALSSLFYFKSVALVNVAYAVSIKRLSLLMSVGYGWLFFRERDVHIRLAGTLCMVLGIVLIALG